MHRISLYAPTIGGIFSLMEKRLERFTSLIEDGFVDTNLADRFVDLELRVQQIDSCILPCSTRDNLFYIDVSYDLRQAVQDLRVKLEDLGDDLDNNNIHNVSTLNYVKRIKNLHVRERYIKEMNELMKEAHKQLARRSSIYININDDDDCPPPVPPSSPSEDFP